VLKVKGVFWTLVTIAVVWAAASVLIPDEILPPQNKKNSDRMLELTVTFEPSPRLNGVNIGYSVGGGAINNDHTRDSGWTRRIQVARGVGVVLFAEQPDVAPLQCQIFEVTSEGLVSLIWDATDSHSPYPRSVVCEIRR